MMKPKKFVASSAIIIAALAGGLFGFRACARSIAEITETRMKIANLAGADIEVTDTEVDAIAHYEYVSVYIDKTGGSYFDRLIHRRTLLFQYDPGSYGAALPSITSPAPNKIQISIPRVSSIFFQRRKWENRFVDYKIGLVDYP